jgi:hypothetical protein
MIYVSMYLSILKSPTDVSVSFMDGQGACCYPDANRAQDGENKSSFHSRRHSMTAAVSSQRLWGRQTRPLDFRLASLPSLAWTAETWHRRLDRRKQS